MERITRQLAEVAPRAHHLHGRVAYLVQRTRPLSPDSLSRLQSLLRSGSPPTGPTDFQLVIAPRAGTISSWSSRAEELLTACGVDGVGRLERLVLWRWEGVVHPAQRAAIAALLHDPMTEQAFSQIDACVDGMPHPNPPGFSVVPVGVHADGSLEETNEARGLGLPPPELRSLRAAVDALGRSPHDIELMMFAQLRSEHCRHQTFHARWTLDGVPQQRSLFEMIRLTHAQHPGHTLSAYLDNAAVISGKTAARIVSNTESRTWHLHREPTHLLMKVETHNHPTGIAPHPGAATGVGGELRDEGATGRGGSPQAGLTGFHVSDLHIPGFSRPWEHPMSVSPRMATPLEVMLRGPLGSTRYGNEFGRPTLTGYFRTFYAELSGPSGPTRHGYHKPVMVAGGMGHCRSGQEHKAAIPPDTPIVVLGGPAMLIGLGGGSASSMASGAGNAQRDFASVQRANPELQRRCQEVIERCTALGTANPILSVHDVGAGGLSNALPELVYSAGRGATFELRSIPCAEPALSPLEIWCNEAQERYVLAISPTQLSQFLSICERERAPVAVVGHTRETGELRLTDRLHGNTPIELPLSLLLGPTAPHQRSDHRLPRRGRPVQWSLPTAELLDRVLTHPAVASKEFLITIADRSVGGCVVRDPLVGPWQVPVADAGVTVTGFEGYSGEAMAMGERPPVALLSGPRSGRLAVAEALTNLVSADVDLSRVVLSANWMCAAAHPGEGAGLYDTVSAVAMELCPALGVSIPVGKDSLSMKARWVADGREQEVVAPLTLVVSAFAPVHDVRRTWTPALHGATPGGTTLIHVDLSPGFVRVGGSIAAQVMQQLGAEAADLGEPAAMVGLFAAARELRDHSIGLAWHDVSDGGLMVTLLEMAFAGRAALEVTLPEDLPPLPRLFAEEPGGVLEVYNKDVPLALQIFDSHKCTARVIGRATTGDRITICQGPRTILQERRSTLHRRWAETSYRMRRLRDDPACADEAFAVIEQPDDPGLTTHLTFDPVAPFVHRQPPPRVAILREQGTNGHRELAAAFLAAGFVAVDVHMSDVLEGRDDLSTYAGLAAGGGFSYGDVLGAGVGWAASIRFHQRGRDAFARFFDRPDTFSLGICNGCQMLSHLTDLIPGAEHWPRFARNRSDRFESRLSLMEVLESPSVLFAGMAGSRIPVAVAHGEGRVAHRSAEAAARVLVAGRFVNGQGQVATRYPANPNGSPGAQTAFTSRDGRATILMPHPERSFRSLTTSWAPADWDPERGPWLRLFQNARRFADGA